MPFGSAVSKTGSTPTSTHQMFHRPCICSDVNERRPWLLRLTNIRLSLAPSGVQHHCPQLF